MLTFLKRTWVPIVVVVAVAVGGVAVARLRSVFGSDAIFTATGSSAEPLEPSYVKRVTYEVYGPSDTAGSVSYLDKKAQPEWANFTGLPWTVTVTTTVPAVIASVVAQGNSDSIGCRITVNGEVKDEKSSAGRDAQASCLVKAA
ncbi:MAG: MmpS family transport accessory protein [Actinomycetota bacterium]|uniref:MmpS family protein n=1 Tax=Mycobacterium lentiflavum TaxID=141349 RepID=A0ABY3UTS7_MYCLN|nr:MmpS family transport accessory protein [Mycobacterium lentiflavum]MEE3065028.1 MmpS family transport accessory protein [Actinomycetota bacterium]ULP41114.1 MmpS family protein [Mycobacterium lentiflavum]